MASEYHGTVKAGGLALPGATVTASQGDKQIVTTSDQQGMFSFSELADGTWTIEVEMLGFEKMARQVGVASDAPSADFALQFLTEEALAAGQGTRKAATAATEAAGTEGAITTEEIADLHAEFREFVHCAREHEQRVGDRAAERLGDGTSRHGYGGPGMGAPGMGTPGMGGPSTDGPAGAQTGARAATGPPAAEVPGCPLGPADPLPVVADPVAAVPGCLWAGGPPMGAGGPGGAGARPLVGRGALVPWHSATGVETRATCTWPARTSASITRFGMHGRSR